MFPTRRSLVLLTATAFLGMLAHTQTQAQEQHRDGFSLALSYDALNGKLTDKNSFGTQGGAAEVNYAFFHGFGATASVLGAHAGAVGSGVPVNLVVLTFGPSYTYSRSVPTPSAFSRTAWSGRSTGSAGSTPKATQRAPARVLLPCRQAAAWT